MASLILAYSSDAQGALLVCTLLPGALDLHRDINSLFFRMVSISLGLSAVEHFLRVQVYIYSRIPTNTPDNDNFSLLFLRSPCGCSRDITEWIEPMNEMASQVVGGAVSQPQVFEIHEVTMHSWDKCSLALQTRWRDSAEGSGVSPIHSLVLRNAIFNDF